MTVPNTHIVLHNFYNKPDCCGTIVVVNKFIVSSV